MRARTLAPVLVACVLLTACGPVNGENAGGEATPSALASDPATALAAPSESPPTEEPTSPAPRPTTSHKPQAPQKPQKRTPPRRPAPAPRKVPHRAVHHAPKAPAHPAGATAECRDGTFSYAAHHQGACSHHGGVLKFFT
jgi:Protein of unknown function (DUF3761)